MKRFPWMTLALCALAALSALVPAATLEYDRARVAGEPWRLLTGQMIHWTARMAMFDLGMLIAFGIWLELRGDRRIAAMALAMGAALTAFTVHALSPGLLVYRGSSGAASALFVLAAVRLTDTSDRWSRVPALAAIFLFLGKAAFEAFTGQAFFAGSLPEGVSVVPLVHLLGGLGGWAAKSTSWRSAPWDRRHPCRPTNSMRPERSREHRPGLRPCFSYTSRFNLFPKGIRACPSKRRPDGGANGEGAG